MSIRNRIKRTYESGKRGLLGLATAGALTFGTGADCAPEGMPTDMTGGETPIEQTQEEPCVALFYEQAGFPQGFGAAGLALGTQEHCTRVGGIYHTVWGVPVAPTGLPFFDQSANGCDECNFAPSLDINVPNRTDSLEDLCVTSSQLWAEDVRLRASVTDDEPVWTEAFVYQQIGEDVVLDPSLKVISTGDSDISEDGTYTVNREFKIVPRDGVYAGDALAIEPGQRFVTVYAGNENRTTTNTRIVNFQGYDNNCVSNIDGLGDVVDYACDNLPRAEDDPSTPWDEGDDQRLFRVYSNGNGGFDYAENAEIDPFSPEAAGGTINHIIDRNQEGYWVAVAGESSGDVYRMTSGVDGPNGANAYNPPNCPHILIFNPEGDQLGRDLFTSTVYRGENVGGGETSETIRSTDN